MMTHHKTTTLYQTRNSASETDADSDRRRTTISNSPSNSNSPLSKSQFSTYPTMRPLSPVLASLANVFKIPISQTSTRPAINRVCNEAVTTTTGPITAVVQPAASRTFSTTSALAKRKAAGAVPPQVNKRISTLSPGSGFDSSSPRSHSERSNAKEFRKNKPLTQWLSYDPLLPLAPLNSASPPLLPKPLPPPLDHPPRLATLPSPAASRAPPRARAPGTCHAPCVRGAAYRRLRWWKVVPKVDE